MPRRRTAILISGRGTNMSALIAAAADPSFPAEITLVISSKPNAAGLKRAAAAGIRTEAVDYATLGSAAAEAEIEQRLKTAGIEIVCLAGFMRLLSEGFVDRWSDRVINIHPSLLPAFTGLSTHARAIDAGVRLHGCTVHFIRSAMDDGPIIGQAAVPVLPDDTPETLAGRVLAAEHRIYPQALALVASERARVVGERVVFENGKNDATAMLISPSALSYEAG